VYALDVTDPGAPAVLWDAPMPGHGLGVALGPVRGAGGAGPSTDALVFAQTAAPGGTAVHALDAATGRARWRADAASPAAPTAMPGGVAAVDLDGAGAITHVVAATPGGELWLLAAATGQGAYGDRPLFAFSDGAAIGAAPAVFARRGTRALYAAVVSGGYADAVALDAAVAGAGRLVAVPLRAETSAALLFSLELGPGRRGFAQPTVAGNELFVVTDAGDVNLDRYGDGEPTGELARYSLSTGERIGAPVALAGGASPVDVTLEGVVHVAAATAARTIDWSAGFDAAGIATELAVRAKTGRQVWMRLR
jgi:hypothetical protein